MVKGEIKSNIKKLWRHLPYILNIENKVRPISLSLHLTNECNLNCDFCYIKNIDKTKQLDYSKLIKFIQVIEPKSVLLTGGEPCLYPYMYYLIAYLFEHNIKIGMFTNGIYLKHINIKDYLHHFDWLRVSINHYIDNKIEFKDPKYPKKLSYNYINHKNSPFELKKKLIDFMDNHRGSYLRVIQDRNISDSSLEEFKSIPEKRIVVLKELTKHYKGKCYIGYLKPYLNGDGLVYPCWCLNDTKTRVRDISRSITDIDHPNTLLKYQDIIMDCKYCRFWDRNEFINYINEKEIEDEDFL
ncbi:hypothetical protein LCGC14_1178110 [marine sediment metagenome]|uniref:Radical SAM core domain-containing protein n=1 Tax=marine sediment metagenome TaxID=412755 RepID=A0A0F9PTE5_9ZZZZ